MRRHKHIKPKAYFEITQDPPKKIQDSLTNSSQNKGSLRLPIQRQYFFIDFAQNCSLRKLEKIKQKILMENPLQTQQYGEYVVTNLEDCSKREQQLLKFQEQKLELFHKKKRIRQKVKKSLDKSKSKLRSLSSFCTKQNLIDQYRQPTILHTEQTLSPNYNILELHDKRLRQKQERVLKRLGLYM